MHWSGPFPFMMPPNINIYVMAFSVKLPLDMCVGVYEPQVQMLLESPRGVPEGHNERAA